MCAYVFVCFRLVGCCGSYRSFVLVYGCLMSGVRVAVCIGVILTSMDAEWKERSKRYWCFLFLLAVFSRYVLCYTVVVLWG